MDQTARALEKETKKWLEKLKKELGPELMESLKRVREGAIRDALKNVQAYIDDCQHFLEKKDFIRAFEAVVYAWGVYETLKRLKQI